MIPYLPIYLTMSLGTPVSCTQTTWLSNTNFSIFSLVSSSWNPLALVPEGWHLIKTAGHTSAKSVLGWISLFLKGLQIHTVISLVWIARPAQVPEGKTCDRVIQDSLSELCIWLWYHLELDDLFESQKIIDILNYRHYSAHFSISGNGGMFFSHLAKTLFHEGSENTFWDPVKPFVCLFLDFNSFIKNMVKLMWCQFKRRNPTLTDFESWPPDSHSNVTLIYNGKYQLH